MGRRRFNPKPLVVVAVVALVLVLLVRTIAGGDDYSEPANTVANRTAKLGREVSALPTQVRTLDRIDLFRKISGWQRQAKMDLAAVRDLKPASEQRIADGFLL